MSNEAQFSKQGWNKLSHLLFGAAAFQALRASCETGLIDLLGANPEGLTRESVAVDLNISGRWLDILLKAASATGLIIQKDARYNLTEDLKAVVHSSEWMLFKATVAFEQYITYPGIQDFTESLVSGSNIGLRHFSGRGDSLYERLSTNPKLQKTFYDYMRSWSQLGSPVLMRALAEIAPKKMLDVGGGDGINAEIATRQFPELRATILDLPGVIDVSLAKLELAALSDRIDVVGIDILKDDFPVGYDTVLFAHQLVIWTEEENCLLLRKANSSLPIGGRVVIFSSITDNSNDGPFVAAMASIYHACIPVEGGNIYSWAQYEGWLNTCGFGEIRRIKGDGWTPHSAIIATKIHAINE
jgi:hypothetical protein